MMVTLDIRDLWKIRDFLVSLFKWKSTDRTWNVVMERCREDSSHGKMCGEWVIVDRCEGTKRTESRKGKEAAGASVPVVRDGTNPTQVLPTQTGMVNNETGEPLEPILPTEVQVDNLGEQQELGCEEEGESSHAGDNTGRGTGAVELAELSMREVLDVVRAMGTEMLTFTRAFTPLVNSSVGQVTPAQATAQATQRAAQTAGTAAGVAQAAARPLGRSSHWYRETSREMPRGLILPNDEDGHSVKKMMNILTHILRKNSQQTAFAAKFGADHIELLNVLNKHSHLTKMTLVHPTQG
ncbi:hypothetical protein F2Q70_00043348 [Brassica cretica]|uniref:Uncharacterized protein n=1 Tax=Brassica cretica TaxID=69181 RepID=A0A8S9KG23_BRACR|nr:hypothetical protein F2Q70_00043348 [Brassica cretica]